MKTSDKIKLIALLIIVIFLGLLVVNVTAHTISEYQQRCQEWDQSQNIDENTPYSQGCYGRSYRTCWNWWPFGGHC